MHRISKQNKKFAQSYDYVCFKGWIIGIEVIHTVANGCTYNTVKSLADCCEYTMRQCPEGRVSHQKDLLISLASLESFLHSLFLYH